MMNTFVKNIKETPYKWSRFFGMAVGIIVVMNPLAFFHGKESLGLSNYIIPGAIGLLAAHFDHEMLPERVLKQLWKSMLLAGLLMLPVSYVQGPTVGYMIVLFLAFILSPLMMKAWYEMQDTRKRLAELGRRRGILEYSDYKICGPVLLVITAIMGFVSKGEPLVIVAFWSLFVFYTLWSIDEDTQVMKNWIYSIENQVEEEDEK